jgi:hypothetical protein
MTLLAAGVCAGGAGEAGGAIGGVEIPPDNEDNCDEYPVLFDGGHVTPFFLLSRKAPRAKR